MTDDEKISLVDSMEDSDLDDHSFEILREFSNDSCSFLRSRCAALLVNFVNEASMNLLIQLSQDEDSFVRTEAYDSLRKFACKQVKEMLFQSIQYEHDELALSYAIISWAEIAKCLNEEGNNELDITLMINMIKRTSSDDNRLSAYYALYLLGYDLAFERILDFLNNESYHVRCSALNLLNNVCNKDNVHLINEAIDILLMDEQTIAVRSLAIKIQNQLLK